MSKAGQRYRRIAQAALSGVVSKGANLLVSLLLIPVTVRYLGAESFGLWITITGAVNMFLLLDIGVANTLTNLISSAYASGDRQRASESFSSAFWIVCAVAALLGLAGVVVWPFVNWTALFRVTSPALAAQTSPAVAVAFAVLLFALPAGLAARVLAGYQELHLANLFAAGGSIGSLLAVLAGVHAHAALPVLVGCFAVPPVLANLLCLLWLGTHHKPWMRPSPRHADRRQMRAILRTGGQFFAIQLAGVIVLNSDNLVLSHAMGPAAVTPYNVTWRMVGYVQALQGLFVAAMWPAFAEAHARGDLQWIRTAYSRLRWVTLAILAVALAVLVPFGKTLARLWAGPAAVPDTPLLLLMCAWMALALITVNQSNLMGAVSRVGRQAVSSIVAAVVNLALSLWWVRTLGSTGVILATVVSYVVFVLAVQVREVHGILHGGPAAATERAAA